MELESGTETDHQPVMRHAEAINMAARLSIFGTLIDRVASIIGVKRMEATIGQEEIPQGDPVSQQGGCSSRPIQSPRPERPRRIERPHFVVDSIQGVRPAALEALYEGIYEKAIMKQPPRRQC